MALGGEVTASLRERAGSFVLYGGVLPCGLLAGLSTLATRITVAGAVGWIAELAVHWQWVYLVGGSVAAVAHWLLSHQNRALSAVVVAVCVGCFLQHAAVLPRVTGGEPTFRVAIANVHHRNADLQRLVSWLEREEPDLIVLQEVNPAASLQLKRLAGYPHVLTTDSAEPFSVVVLSRHPLREVQTVAWGRDPPGQWASFRGEVLWKGRPVAFAAVHLAAPISPHYLRLRDELLADTVRWAVSSKAPALIAGDLNNTPWSRSFRWAAEQGMRSANGLGPTWPRVTRFSALLPIDHVLASSQWTARERSLGPNVGSDHRPVLVALALSVSPSPPEMPERIP